MRLINPLRRDRAPLFGGARWLLPRRVLAAALLLTALAAAALHTRAPTAGAPVLVTAHDLAPGVTLTAADLRLADLPADAVPAGALRDPPAAVGRVLAGAARSGEPVTDVRLVGVENTRLASPDPSAVAVPVRLADPAAADLLHPGSHVDAVGADGHGGGALLAQDGIVVAVRAGPATGAERAVPGSSGGGALLVLAVPRAAATRLAAASLEHAVAVTLR
jgi:Flp pilus assembly protein CpaB